MIVSSLVGVSLILGIALDTAEPDAPVFNPPQLSMRQKEAALLPLVQRATECITRKVRTDSRYSDMLRPAEINDLIVDSMPACAPPVRAMIDAHDRMYGLGSGDAFFLGPYLDVLPGAVIKQVAAPQTRQ